MAMKEHEAFSVDGWARDPDRTRAAARRPGGRSPRSRITSMDPGPYVAVALVFGVSSARSCSGAASSSSRTRRACCSSSAATPAPSATTGLRWANPFYTKRDLAARAQLREREAQGQRPRRQPDRDRRDRRVEGGRHRARRSSTSTNYEHYVHVQTESALRNLATQLPVRRPRRRRGSSLRGHDDEIAEQLRKEIQERLAQAGIEVVEARITHLAYAPEIAQAMLQRQQAGAIIAARTRIVEGAVGMVEMALERLVEARAWSSSTRSARRRWCSNLLVVLCGERATQPVVNTGTLYTASADGRAQGVPAAHRSRAARGDAALGRRRTAQRSTRRSSSCCATRWRGRSRARAEEGRSVPLVSWQDAAVPKADDRDAETVATSHAAENAGVADRRHDRGPARGQRRRRARRGHADRQVHAGAASSGREMGVVYAARDGELGRAVALKAIPAGIAASSS